MPNQFKIQDNNNPQVQAIYYQMSQAPRKVHSLVKMYETSNIVFFACEPHNFKETLNEILR